MQYTNERGVPEHIARAIMRRSEKYSMGGADYSATGLLKPAHMSALQREHFDELKEDVIDGYWRVWGQTAHDLLADGHDAAIQEVRFFGAYFGKTVSGQADVVTAAGGLFDTKTTSAAAMAFGDVECQAIGSDRTYKVSADWIAQLNIYAHLIRHGEIRDRGLLGWSALDFIRDHFQNQDWNLTSLAISVAVRDWKRTDWDVNMPHSPAFDIAIPMWPDEKTLQFITERIAAHENPPDDCAALERWARQPHWTLEIDGKRFMNGKRFFDEGAAAAAKDEQEKKGKKNVAVIFHEANSVRCAGYCNVCTWCEPHARREAAKNGTLQG